jgi:superfamily I DNA/RNA helicase
LSQPLEEKLKLFQIPYVIKGSLSFFERSEIKMVSSLLRFCVWQRNEDLEKILLTCLKGFGKKTLATYENENENASSLSL